MGAPLSNLTRKTSGLHKWYASRNRAFEELKGTLFDSPIIAAPNCTSPHRCHIDASPLVIGKTLTQHDSTNEEPVNIYFSKRFSSAEDSYWANDRDMLGLIYFLQLFR